MRKLVYICSPYRGDVSRNILQAQLYCNWACEKGVIPYAPHLFFTQFLCDSDERERELALSMCEEMLSKCDELWVFGDTFSDGMRREISCAKKAGIPIRYFTSHFVEVMP